MCALKSEATKLFQEMKKKQVEPSIDTINAYFQACGRILKKANVAKEEKKQAGNDDKKKDKIKNLIKKAAIELPDKCGNYNCTCKLTEEQLMSGFSRNLNTYTVKCAECKGEFVPQMEIYLDAKKTKHYYLLSPPLFLKEFFNLIEIKTSAVLFTVLLFLIFYFHRPNSTNCTN